MHHRLKLVSFIGAAAIGISAVAGSAAAGVNVLPNGDFSDSMTGWHGTPNAKFEVDSGIGLLANTFDELSEDSMATVYQCIPVSDAKNYHVFGAVYIPSGQQRSGYARLVTTFYPTNNCIGVPLDVHKSAPFHETGAWLTDSSDLLRTDPKTAYSLKVELVVKKNSTEQAALKSKAFMAKFDNIKVMATNKPVAEPELPAAGEEPTKPGAKQPTIVPPAPKDTGSPAPPPGAAAEDDGPVDDQPAAGDDSASPEPPMAPQTGEPGDPGLPSDSSSSPEGPSAEAPGDASFAPEDKPGTPSEGSDDDPAETPVKQAQAPAAPATGNSAPLEDTATEAEGGNLEETTVGDAHSNTGFAFAAAGGAALLGIVLFTARRRRRQHDTERGSREAIPFSASEVHRQGAVERISAGPTCGANGAAASVRAWPGCRCWLVLGRNIHGDAIIGRYLPIDRRRYLRILPGVRRKPDSLLPIELSLLRAGLAMKLSGEAEFHGYAVAKELREHAEARRLTAHGTLYRALERLEQRSLLESRMEDPEIASAENRPRRRLYHVTALGAAAVQKTEEAAAQPGLPARQSGTVAS